MFVQNGNIEQNSNSIEIKHKVQVHHPGKGDDNIENQILVEVRDKNEFPTEYYMNVESVICFDSVCKIVPVRIYWNNIGEYNRYEIDDGITLEKYEADLFEEEDYKKIHSILSDLNSPFKDVRADEILTIVDETHNDVDAISGATALELDEKDTVPGAALTCFTLWHWAHGEIIPIIRQKTAESCKPANFETYLTEGNQNYKLFAIEKLTNIKFYNDVLIDATINQATNNSALLKPAIKYIEEASSDVYAKAINDLFQKGNQYQKLATINSMVNTEKNLSKEYLNKLSQYLPKSNSYQEVSLLLKLMEDKNPNSQDVIKHALPMLDKEFLIARRVYWFLKDQNLDKKQLRLLKKFYRKHKDQL